MLLNCEECPGRGNACDGCVVAVLLDPTPRLPREVAEAIDVLRGSGLIGPAHLALVPDPARETGPLPFEVPQRRVG
jgi:hypothetical protein